MFGVRGANAVVLAAVYGRRDLEELLIELVTPNIDRALMS
jgi:hypothetical protein